MHKSRSSVLAAAMLVAGLGGLLAGCEQEGPAERAGEQVDQAVEETREAVEQATEEAGEQVERTGDAIREQTQ